MAATSLDRFLEVFSKNRLFWPKIAGNRERNPALFDELGGVMTEWAEAYLGDRDFPAELLRGYNSFVLDVSKSQVEYEKRGTYLNKSYEEVYQSVYNNPEHMQLYHWGVFTTTFAWEHHLRIYGFFKDYFLSLLPPDGHLLDLGSGSGIWGLLLLHKLPGWTLEGADISERSVKLATDMIRTIGYADRATYAVADALAFRGESKFQAAISCFLLEHVEGPDRLLANLAENLNPGGYAFVTGALTAAEVDHITEFKRESELVCLAEDAGFRVVATYSASPDFENTPFRLLPRSMALVLQKRRNDIW